MVETLQYVNIVANSLICTAMTLFYVLLFGNSNSIVHKWNILQHWSLKIGLVTVIASSAWNAMNVVYKVVVPRAADYVALSQVPVGEILMNIGLALLFCWAVYFHKFHFLKVAPPKSSSKRKAKKKSRAR